MGDLEKSDYVNSLIRKLKLANKEGLLFEVVNEWIPDSEIKEQVVKLANACYEWDVH